jgi:hypothetical protein
MEPAASIGPCRPSVLCQIKPAMPVCLLSFVAERRYSFIECSGALHKVLLTVKPRAESR